jgi:hypothetical protein
MTLVALFAMTTGAWAAAAYYVVGNFTNWSTNDAYKMTLNTECTSTTEYMLTLNLPADAQFKVVKDDGQGQTWYPDGMGNAYGENGELSGAGKYTVYFRPNGDGNPDWFYGVMYVAAAEPEPVPGTVTLNEAKTIASFDMPTYDLTVDYELVRDMSIGLIAQVGDDPQVQPRYRVKKEDNVFKPADLSPAQVMALFSVNDQIEQKVLTPTTDYIVNIYAIDEEGQPTGNPMTFADFTFEPGIYAVKAVAAEGSPYDGESALSNKFVLFQGYEVYVPAGEYVTYYRNEALRVDEADKENFKLYTVSSVSGDKATLSNAFDAAPSNTPFLVYNNTNESKTVLLIPCNEPDLALTVADQFQGTMEEKTFTDADMAAADYYVCNGKQFVKVRGAGTLGANKAYLKFVTNQQLSAPQYISISGDLGEGTTRIDNLNVNDNENGEWYDLNGRKLNGKPAQKGIYIKNGKKIVVK